MTHVANLLLIGPPGAGKGTQAEGLVKAFRLTHLASGDIFRKEMAEETDLGRKAREFIDRGQLVPDDLVVRMMGSRIEATVGGFLLDGFPRTVGQAVALDGLLGEIGRALDAVVCLGVDDRVLLDRLTARLTCTQCGGTFHRTANPPRKAGTCDHCGAALEARSDDKTETIRKRLAVYREQTAPVIAHYGTTGLLVEVDGSGSIDGIRRNILERLRERGLHA